MKAVKLLEYSVNIDEVNFGILATKFTLNLFTPPNFHSLWYNLMKNEPCFIFIKEFIERSGKHSVCWIIWLMPLPLFLAMQL